MKTIHSIALTVIMALLSFSAPAPAFAQMEDKLVHPHSQGPGMLTEMCTLDKGEMLSTCREPATVIGNRFDGSPVQENGEEDLREMGNQDGNETMM